MKRTIIYLATAVLALVSCDALKENPDSFVRREDWYQTTIQCRTTVNSCYYDLHDICIPVGIFFAIEGVTDLFYTRYNHADAQLDVSPSYCSTSQTVWNNCYQGIMKCNETIWCVENISKLDDEQKMPYAAEARVMRAYYYYFLTNFFNGVPYYTYPVDTKDAMEKVRQLPRTDANFIRSELYKDLKENALPWFTAENGLKARPDQIKGNRAGYALCLMLMAKFAMWYNDWKGAIEPLKLLEELYGDFTDNPQGFEQAYPLENIRGCYKNTKESIFELQNEYDPSGLEYACKWAYVAQPEKISGKWDGVDMNWFFGSTVIHGEGIQANPYFASFMPAGGDNKNESTNPKYTSGLLNPLPLKVSESASDFNSELGRRYIVLDEEAMKTGMKNGVKIDRRVYYKLGIFGTNKAGTKALFNEVKKYGRPWAGPQFWRQDQRSNSDGNNYKLMRYADALLMMAECYCRLDDLSTAQKYLNVTRARAGVDPLPYSTQDEMMSNIMDERARELAGELHRKWDLVRWGIWYERVVENTQNSVGLKDNIRRYHQYYPISDVECSLSNYVLTNDEYEK